MDSTGGDLESLSNNRSNTKRSKMNSRPRSNTGFTEQSNQKRLKVQKEIKISNEKS